MFKINGTTIHLSRGDRASFSVIFKDGDTPYTFQVGDVLRFTVTKNFKTENYVLQKEITITAPTQKVNIELEPDETLFGGTIASPVKYQYDVVLNNMYSVICYDLNGAPELILYPRSKDITD
jgi:hypothetical protein